MEMGVFMHGLGWFGPSHEEGKTYQAKLFGKYHSPQEKISNLAQRTKENIVTNIFCQDLTAYIYK